MRKYMVHFIMEEINPLVKMFLKVSGNFSEKVTRTFLKIFIDFSISIWEFLGHLLNNYISFYLQIQKNMIYFLKKKKKIFSYKKSRKFQKKTGVIH